MSRERRPEPEDITPSPAPAEIGECSHESGSHVRDNARSRGERGDVTTPEELLTGDSSDTEHMAAQKRDTGGPT